MLTLNQYQEQAKATAIYPESSAIVYPILGLVGEAGELANKYKKVMRDDNGILYDEKKAALISELGDCLWYIAALANDLGVTLEQVGNHNLHKLSSRATSGTLQGSGDAR